MTAGQAELPELEVGDRLPELGLNDHDGKKVSFRDQRVAGRPVVLFVCCRAGDAGIDAGLAEFAGRFEEIRSRDARMYAITAQTIADNAALAKRLSLPFPVLSDADGVVVKTLELGQEMTGACTLVTDRSLRIAARIEAGEQGGHAAAALAALARLQSTESPRLVRGQAPVLLVPGVLSPEHCRRLIELWRSGDRMEGGVSSSRRGRQILDADFKRREDVPLPDLSPAAQEIAEIFSRRLLPEIKRAFAFEVTHLETLRIGCYDADAGGYFRAHRDNTTPYTAHRRFAMTLNLNTGDYEGGYLKFPEYGPEHYCPDVGGAVVFSCSLLHEAMEVTEGRRFAMFSFFSGDAEEAMRRALISRRQAPSVTPTVTPPIPDRS